MGRPKGYAPIEPRFWKFVDKTEDCWLWTGADNGNGYAVFSVSGTNALAHRVSYELVNGPIPEGLVIDHLCRVRLCVNPAHLEAVTTSVNNKRGLKGDLKEKPTHCKLGHEFTSENTYIAKAYGTPVCLTCNRERTRMQYATKIGRTPRDYNYKENN